MGDSGFVERYGPWAIVTGASDGIGRAFCVRLAEIGLNVVLVARRRSRLTELATELEGTYGVATRVLESDLSDPAQISAVIDATSDLDAGLVVACAGYGTSGAFVDLDRRDEVRLVDVNCRAVVEMAHAHAERLKGRRSGGLILMSSIVAFQGVPGSATYAASKAFIQSFGEALAVELAPHRIDVLTAAPGPVDSGFGERAGMRMTSAATPDEVAVATLGVLGRRSRVKPGVRAKVLGMSLASAPRPLRVRIMAGIMRGFTAHQSPA